MVRRLIISNRQEVSTVSSILCYHAASGGEKYVIIIVIVIIIITVGNKMSFAHRSKLLLFVFVMVTDRPMTS